MDFGQAVERLVELDRHDTLAAPFRFFAQDGQVLFLALLAGLFFARGKWRSLNGRHGVAAAGFSALLALGTAQLIASQWDRPRHMRRTPAKRTCSCRLRRTPRFPQTTRPAPTPSPSPSSCATARAACSRSSSRRWSRCRGVALGTHYPTDVLGGAALGALATLLLWAPPVRGPLHRLADWAGQRYERMTGALGRTRAPRQAP